MKQLLYGCLAFLSIGILAACEGHKVVDSKAKLRFINASSANGDLNIDVDYQRIYATNVQYMNYSLFREFIAGRRKLQIKTASGNVLIDTAVQLMENRAYSVLVYDSMFTLKYKLMDELFVAPAGSNCKIRFIHAGNDIGVVNVKKDTSSQVVFAACQNGDISNYESFNAGDHSFKISGTYNYAQPNYPLEAGYFYTMLLKGITSSTGADSVSFFVVRDNGNYE